MINGTTISAGQGVQSTVQQGGYTVANATHNYGMTSNGGSGLYVNYTLTDGGGGDQYRYGNVGQRWGVNQY
nr:hypothetical protein [Yersinia pestis]